MPHTAILRTYGLTQTGLPSVEPITRAEAKLFLRETQDDQDAVIDRLIKYAREHIEKIASGRQLITATYEMTIDGFPTIIYLPKAPVQSVTSIQYVDTDGDTQTLATSGYQTDFTSDPARIVEAYGEVWPETRDELNAVTVTFIAGFGDAASDVPENYKSLALRIVTDRFDVERGDTVIGTSATSVPNRIDDELFSLRVPVV